MRRQRAAMGLTPLRVSLFPKCVAAALSLSGCAFSLSIASQGKARAGQETRRRNRLQQSRSHNTPKRAAARAAAAFQQGQSG